jgi:hypothetical protein
MGRQAVGPGLLFASSLLACNAILGNDVHPLVRDAGGADAEVAARADASDGSAGKPPGDAAGGDATMAGDDSGGSPDSSGPGDSGEAGVVAQGDGGVMAVDSGACGTSCYTGPAGTLGHRLCSAGVVACDAGGSVCSGETLPSVEICGVDDNLDENCDDLPYCTGSVRSAAPFTGGTASLIQRIKLDAAGNEYWLGDYYQAFQVLGHDLPGGGEQGDIFYAKVSPSGQAAWVNGIVGLGWQYSRDLVVHASNGDITIAGLFTTASGETFKIGSTQIATSNVGSGAAFIARFDSSGNALWVDTIGEGYGTGDGVSLAESPDGGVYVWTGAQGALTFAQGTNKSSLPFNFGDRTGCSGYVYLLAVGTDGTLGKALGGCWAQYTTTGRIAVTPQGTIYVTGSHNGSAIDFGNAGSTNVGATGYLLKLDPPTATTSFNPLRTADVAQVPGPLALDSAGNIYVAAGGLIGKWTSAGGNEWTKIFDSKNASSITGITVDPADYVTFAGTCSGSVDFNPNGTGGAHSSSGPDVCLAKYKADGTHLWSHLYGDQSTQQGGDVVADPLGYIHMLGVVAGDFDPGNGNPVLHAGTSQALLHAVFNP